MRISEFLDESGWTEQQLAAAALTHQSTINRLKNDELEAGLELALRVQTATGGRVRAEDVPMSRETRQALAEVKRTATDSAA